MNVALLIHRVAKIGSLVPSPDTRRAAGAVPSEEQAFTRTTRIDITAVRLLGNMEITSHVKAQRTMARPCRE